MQLHTTPPSWLEWLAWAFLISSFLSTLYVVVDIFIRGNHQQMRIMEIVYPMTALYFGPAGLWFYIRYGAPQSKDVPEWVHIGKAVTHCGAGCALGDIIGEWAVFFSGILIAGKALYADFAITLILAWLLGIGFQYATIAPMRNLSVTEGIIAAIKADTISIAAFQIGMFFSMYVYQELLFPHPLAKTTASYWFFMQIAMIVGFFTAVPANYFLIKKGLKESM